MPNPPDRAAQAPSCPLCGSRDTTPFAEAWDRRYLRCPRCKLTFLHPCDRLSPDDERARYETHENDPGDERYRRFLGRLATPLMARLAPGARGLDYGSGPGPTLSVMLAERGFPTAIYDPFFAPDPSVLGHTYDFVTCSETVEHFHEPGREFDRLATLLEPGGLLAVMTHRLDDDERFVEWWYARDPTHVSFYRVETLRWIADTRQWALEHPTTTVSFFRRPAQTAEAVDAVPRRA